jgi:hypothetical protein
VLWAGSSPPFFAPDGRVVAACVPEPAVVGWDVSTGRELLRVPAGRKGRPAVTAACFSPDARTLALQREDGSVTLWELATGRERARLGGGRNRLAGGRPAPAWAGPEALAYSPDGRFLATITGRAVRLWDVRTRQERGRFEGHAGATTALAYAPDGKTLATGGTDGTGLVWDVTRLTEAATRPAAVKAEVLTAAWQVLAGEDAARAFDGLTTLAAVPGQAVPFLRERLKPTAVPDGEALAGWIAALDGEDFAERQKAAMSLRTVGPTAGPALREALAANPSAEVKRQVEALLADLDQARPTGDDLRAVRAVEVLEMIGTAEARELLTALAGGAPGAPATEAARASLARRGKSL